MERSIAEKYARELNIDITQIVREYYEILLLRELSRENESNCIIFKGGTALRLVYDSPRFSEDLDFSLLSDCIGDKFEELVKKLVSAYSELEITDIAEKYYTYLAEIKVKKEYLDLPFRIKFEISKRTKENYKWDVKLLKSPCSIYSALMKVATAEQLYEDKKDCLEERKKPKDLFDFWYLSELLDKPYNPEATIDEKVLKRDLRKFLPSEYHEVIKKL